MPKSYSVIRLSRSCGWKSPSVFCTFMLLASCSGGGSNSGGDRKEAVTTAPSAPSSLSLAIPGSSPGSNQLPTIGVNGVVSGDTVRLFSDSACSAEIGSAESSDTSVNITASSALPLSLYTFYANATNAIGTSPCSTASVSYDLGAVPSAPSGLARLNPSTLNGSDSTPELTISGVVDGNTVNVFTNSNCSSEVGSGVAAGASVNIITSALPLGSYTFYANSANTYGSSSCSAASVSYNYEAVPSAPTSLSLVTPSGSPGLDSTPTISVGGVVNGNTVRLFSDSACTTTEIGSAASLGTSVNITVNSVLAFSLHTIYANATNAIGTSPCSNSSVSYKVLDCPSGFIPVGHNTDVGTTSDFCVMKYEAKARHSASQIIDADGCSEPDCTTSNWGTDYVPVSSSTGSPWRRINPINASAECNSLNTGGATKYNLISNPEWMTIARNAESVSSNWSTGSVGYGVMARGWAAAVSRGDPWNNTTVAPSTDSNCLYNTGQNTCASSGDHLYKRTLNLSNGEEIWDLSGNVGEWVDWSHTTAGLQLGPITCAASWVEFPVAASYACLSGLINQVFPATSNGSSKEGFGFFYGHEGGVARRGGRYIDGPMAGAFALNLSGYSMYTDDGSFGFRCVYRP